MGSLLVHTLTNFFLCHYEKAWLNETWFKLVVCRRFVDDIFVMVKSKEHLKLFISYMNLKHKYTKFTFEAEDLFFFIFDIKVTHKTKRFVTSIFGKATLSGVFTNYDSVIFDICKVVLVQKILFWCFKICFSRKIFKFK